MFSVTVEHEHQQLRRERRPEHGRAADPPQEERHEEQAEHHAVEDRGDDVDRLDQVLGQVGEQREADRDQPPEHGEPLRGGDVVRVGRPARVTRWR